MPLRGQEKEKYKTRTDGPTGNDWTKKKLVYYTHTDTNVETDRHSEEDTLYIGWWRAGKKAFVLYFFYTAHTKKIVTELLFHYGLKQKFSLVFLIIKEIFIWLIGGADIGKLYKDFVSKIMYIGRRACK